jgi:hypothetical protein
MAVNEGLFTIPSLVPGGGAGGLVAAMSNWPSQHV